MFYVFLYYYFKTLIILEEKIMRNLFLGILLLIFLSACSSHGSTNSEESQGLSIPKETIKGELLYKSSYGGEIRKYNGKTLFYTNNHSYTNANLYNDNKYDLALHKAAMEKYKILAIEQHNRVFYSTTIYQLRDINRAIRNRKDRRDMEKLKPLANAIMIGGILTLGKLFLMSNSKSSSSYSSKSTSSNNKQTQKNITKKEKIGKFSGGVKSITKKGLAVGDSQIYRIICNGGGEEKIYKFKNRYSEPWKRIGITPLGNGITYKDTVEEAGEKCCKY